jgi:hypothetical protein
VILLMIGLTERCINMEFKLEDNEAAFIIRVIGQLPTESGAFPLHQKLVAQYQSQDVQAQEKQEETAKAE